MSRPLRTRPKHRRLAAFAATTACVLTAGCGGGGTPDRPAVENGGPLAGIGLSAEGASDNTSFAVPAGQRFMWGVPGVVNDGKAPVTIDRMRLDGFPAEVQLLHTYAAGTERRSSPAGAVDWDEQTAYPRLNGAAGYVVDPGGRAKREDTQLLFVMRGDTPGVYRSRKVVIDYHVGSRRYRRTLGNGFTACVIAKGEKLACPGAAQ